MVMMSCPTFPHTEIDLEKLRGNRSRRATKLMFAKFLISRCSLYSIIATTALNSSDAMPNVYGELLVI
jgi:hypothetical protein